jgi:DNA damage-binding protein 1
MTSMTLFSGNVIVDISSDLSLITQITKKEIRLISLVESKCVASWSPRIEELITVAAANESGQIVVVATGGQIQYLEVEKTDNTGFQISLKGSSSLGKEVSCVNLNPFEQTHMGTANKSMSSSMDIDDDFRSKRIEQKSKIVVVGLWDETSILVLSLDESFPLKLVSSVQFYSESPGPQLSYTAVAQKMTRSLCLVTLGSSCSSKDITNSNTESGKSRLNMMLIGLGDGTLISYIVYEKKDGCYTFESRKEVSIGTRALSLIPFFDHTGGKGTCVLASGDRPTIIYLSGGGIRSSRNARLCYSNIHISCDEDLESGVGLPNIRNSPLTVNAASPFYSSLLFGSDAQGCNEYYSLCMSDDIVMRIGMIDNIQKLHVTTHKLGMPPRKLAHDLKNRLICVGCIDHNGGGTKSNTLVETNMGNCIRFFDDSTFEEIDLIDLDPYEMILSLVCTHLKVTKEDFNLESTKAKDTADVDVQDSYNSYIVYGTGYAFPEDDEPSRGRIIVLECYKDRSSTLFSRKIRQVAELQVRGGVFSICPFFEGSILASINSKTRLCRLVGNHEDNSVLDLKVVGAGHHGHIMSLHLKSLADEFSVTGNNKREQLAIVGDLVRSISVMKYYPEYQTLEEIARDFNQNWTTAVEMLTDNIYLGAENFSNIFTLRRNPLSPLQEIRCRLDTVGVFHLGELINKFMKGSLVLPSHESAKRNLSLNQILGDIDDDANHKMIPQIGSQTLFGTVDGTLGTIIGLDASTASFFVALQNSMAKIVKPVGNLKHGDYRSFRIPRNCQASYGFIDGDFVESFPELDPAIMNEIVKDMNKENSWYPSKPLDSKRSTNAKDGQNLHVLTVEDVLAMIEDMAIAH